jgi:hypothetical protein
MYLLDFEYSHFFRRGSDKSVTYENWTNVHVTMSTGHYFGNKLT